MPLANLKNVQLDYLDEGKGFPVLLVHGFVSNSQVNWVNTGWVKLLTSNGYRVIAFDNRGHGKSRKFYNETDYSLAIMAADAIALLDYLKIDKCHIIGYSMGARISVQLALGQARRLAKIILAGNGYGMLEETGDWANVRDALLAPSLDSVTDEKGRQFRAFADQTGADHRALAACVMGVREMFTEAQFRQISNEVLVAIGSKDTVAGSGEKLVALMENAEFLPIPSRDHMRAVGDKVFMQGTLDFLAR